MYEFYLHENRNIYIFNFNSFALNLALKKSLVDIAYALLVFWGVKKCYFLVSVALVYPGIACMEKKPLMIKFLMRELD